MDVSKRRLEQEKGRETTDKGDEWCRNSTLVDQGGDVLNSANVRGLWSVNNTNYLLT